MKVKFLIAEEVRRETEGKVTVLGLFSGDTILLVRRDQPKYLPEQVQVLEAIENISERISNISKSINSIINFG